MDQLPAITAARIASPRRWRLGRPRMTPLARREARQGYLFISPWIIGFLAFTALPMLATFAFTFLNLTLSPGGANSVRRAGQLRPPRERQPRLGVARRHVQVRGDLAAALDRAPVHRSRSALNSRYLLGASVMRTLFFVPYVVPFVAGA